MAGELGWRIIDLARLAPLRQSFNEFERHGTILPALAQEIRLAIEQLEESAPRYESETFDRNEMLTGLRRVLRALDDPRKLKEVLARVDVVELVLTNRCIINFRAPFDEDDDDPPALVMCPDGDGHLYRGLVQECLWLGDLVDSWPDPIRCHNGDGSMAILPRPEVVRLNHELTDVARRKNWMAGRPCIDDRERAQVVFDRLRRLVWCAVKQPQWSVAIDTFL